MISRPFWVGRIHDCWRKTSLVWLSGVRRVGKTCLSKSIEGITYLNCDLPSTRRRLSDPEAFFESRAPGSTIVFDEIHRLPDPSLVLKIGVDAYPQLRMMATGSSTLAATRKFSDSLAGRKRAVHLCPVLWDECLDGFGVRDLDERLLRGGLPERLLSSGPDPGFYAEWMDSFFARDIEELFKVRGREGFMSLLGLLLFNSGGMTDYTRLSRECGISRPTVRSYIDGMTTAHAVFPVRPFHGGGRREIVARPKLYAFDTGFVAYAREWESIRPEDRGPLWEHLVLDALRVSVPERQPRYWRDKSGHEVDFVIQSGGGRVDAFECKVTPDAFHGKSLRVFRRFYPRGRNYLVCPYVKDAYRVMDSGLEVTVVSTGDLLSSIRG